MKLPRSTRFFRRAMRGLPAPKFGVGYEPGVRIPMADGVELLADHYFPEGVGVREFPTLVVRSPYGRGFPWAALYGVAFAEQGFHVLIQSSRGTAGSGGTARPWRGEGPDGQATVAWLRRQKWFDGRLGLLGPSAMAYAAWALAAEPPPELKAMVVHLPLHDPYGFFYRGGVFALEDALIASAAYETQHLGPRRFIGATLRLARGMKRIVGAERPVEAFGQVMGLESPALRGAAAHPERTDGYWQGTDLLTAAEGLAVPTLVVSGWSDVALDQALQQYGRLPTGSRSLLIGPWTHTSALQQGFGTVFGESVAWLQGQLVDQVRQEPQERPADPGGMRPDADRAPYGPPADPVRTSPIADPPPPSGKLAGSTPPQRRVRVAVGPGGDWREFSAWPPAAVPVTWFVRADGSLSREAPGSAAPVGTFDHDPADPVPSVGGSGLGRMAGVRDNAKLEQRADVLVFSSPPLAEAVEVIGVVAADVVARVHGGDGATVFVRLCDVDERGRSRNVCDGIARVPDAGAAARTVPVAMAAAAHRFLPGHRIRVQISAGAYPRFAVSRQAYRMEVQPGSAVVVPVV